MASPFSRLAELLGELKRRKVYHVTVVYVVLAVAGLELLDILVPETSLPAWAGPFFLGLAIVGLPLVVVFAWTFDITPGGVVRTPDRGGDALPPAAVPPTAPSPTTWEEMPGSPALELDPTAVAVLPFENLSRSEDAEPFAVGLHDDLLTELSRASALTVIARTSVRGYRGSGKSLREIAGELGAGTIVEGGVQKAGSRVRLNIQVIDARSGVHRWAERYDRELSAETIFELQSELAARIMAALEARLTPTERTRVQEPPTDDLEAYRLYALGREAAMDRTEEGFRKAASYYERAIRRDPEYALAWAGLGMVIVGLVDYGHVEADGSLERGIEASLRAAELDPGLAEAHGAVGNLRIFQKNAPAARDALRRAVELEPGLPIGYHRLAWLELLTGHAGAALAAATRATRLDPLHPEARGNLAMAHLGVGDAERALAEASAVLESRPRFSWARLVAGWALHHLGRPGERDRELERLEEPGERQYLPWVLVGRGFGALRRGDEAGVRDVLVRLETDAPFKAAVLHAALGDDTSAVAAMETAQPLFWDEALVVRYFSAPPFDRLRRGGALDRLLAGLDRDWEG